MPNLECLLGHASQDGEIHLLFEGIQLKDVDSYLRNIQLANLSLLSQGRSITHHILLVYPDIFTTV